MALTIEELKQSAEETLKEKLKEKTKKQKEINELNEEIKFLEKTAGKQKPIKKKKESEAQ